MKKKSNLSVHNEAKIVKTSKSNPEILIKIKKASDLLMKQNKEAYIKLAKM